ncbi:hypothetical protein B7494_g3719 [Chlorociboria aeruginascens]|nr:hypothetical protein B7494_g3719 [Chlorociboria aeruginascens]
MTSSLSPPSSPNSTTSTSPRSPVGSNPFTTSSSSNLLSRSSTPVTPTQRSILPQPYSSPSQTRLPPPHRTLSEPSSPLTIFRGNRTNSPHTARSATIAPKTRIFGQDGKETPIRRQSNEAKTNVYTECGRHGDEWLFGGFSLGDTVRKIWEKKA